VNDLSFKINTPEIVILKQKIDSLIVENSRLKSEIQNLQTKDAHQRQKICNLTSDKNALASDKRKLAFDIKDLQTTKA
jgi:regulator of replication initiation timing